jgi:hypothetical protein
MKKRIKRMEKKSRRRRYGRVCREWTSSLSLVAAHSSSFVHSMEPMRMER